MGRGNCSNGKELVPRRQKSNCLESIHTYYLSCTVVLAACQLWQRASHGYRDTEGTVQALRGRYTYGTVALGLCVGGSQWPALRHGPLPRAPKCLQRPPRPHLHALDPMASMLLRAPCALLPTGRGPLYLVGTGCSLALASPPLLPPDSRLRPSAAAIRSIDKIFFIFSFPLSSV